MLRLLYLIIILFGASVMMAQEAHITEAPAGGLPEGKTKSQLKTLQDQALVFSSNVRTYNISKARDFVNQAIQIVEEQNLSAPEVYYTAALVEDYAFNYERNRPGREGKAMKMDEALKSASDCYGYCQKAYEIMSVDPHHSKKLKGMGQKVQKMAMNYYIATKGFLVQANNCYQDGALRGALFYFSRSYDGGTRPMLRSLYEGKNGSTTYAAYSHYMADSTLLKALYNCAVVATAIDSSRLAIAYYDSLKDRRYELAKIYANTTNLYAQFKDTTLLLRELEQAMNALPDENAYPKQILQIYLNQNNWGRAERIGNLINRKWPDDVECLVLQGQLFERRGKTDKALTCYFKAYDIDPLQEALCAYIGRVFVTRSQNLYQELYDQVLLDEIDKQVPPLQDKALEWFRKAYELDINHSDQMIPQAMRDILYKKFTKAGCPNKEELIAEYNKISGDYGYSEF